MALAVNHNTMAANVANTLSSKYSHLSKSVERLSSGLRINSAADDAAGLAIRELMRADVTALHQGMRNANDAISMLQTADGALSIIDEKLIRMKELAEQASTGTYDSVQRQMIDSEFQQMASEIERIALATDFNGIKLLSSGSRSSSSSSSSSGASSSGSTTTSSGTYNHTATVSNILNSTTRTASAASTNATLTDPTALEGTTTITVTNSNTKSVTGANGTLVSVSSVDVDGSTGATIPSSVDLIWTGTTNNPWQISIGGTVYSLGNQGVANQYAILSNTSTATKYAVNAGGLETFTFTVERTGTPANSATVNLPLIRLTSGNPTFSYSAQGAASSVNGSYTVNGNQMIFTFDLGNSNTVTSTLNVSGGNIDPYTVKQFQTTLTVTKQSSGGGGGGSGSGGSSGSSSSDSIPDDVVKIHFGSGNDSSEDYYYINYQDCTLDGLGLDGVDIKTQENAQKALKTVHDAIVLKDESRAYFGAMQNRLENTIENIQIQASNLQNAESRISDVDVASEMTTFVKNQVLVQAAVAMLSQANSMPQMALRLIGA